MAHPAVTLLNDAARRIQDLAELAHSLEAVRAVALADTVSTGAAPVLADTASAPVEVAAPADVPAGELLFLRARVEELESSLQNGLASATCLSSEQLEATERLQRLLARPHAASDVQAAALDACRALLAPGNASFHDGSATLPSLKLPDAPVSSLGVVRLEHPDIGEVVRATARIEAMGAAIQDQLHGLIVGIEACKQWLDAARASRSHLVKLVTEEREAARAARQETAALRLRCVQLEEQLALRGTH